jgi:hypothetical protein
MPILESIEGNQLSQLALGSISETPPRLSRHSPKPIALKLLSDTTKIAVLRGRTLHPSKHTSWPMRGRIASILIIMALVIGVGVGYFTGVGNSTSKTATITASVIGTMPYQVVNPNITVRGQVAGTPYGALEFPCVTYLNQSITAILIKYNGTYYYLSYYGTFNKLHATETLSGGVLSNTWYAIWYDNSTVYCVSPKVQWWNACPA